MISSLAIPSFQTGDLDIISRSSAFISSINFTLPPFLSLDEGNSTAPGTSALSEEPSSRKSRGFIPKPFLLSAKPHSKRNTTCSIHERRRSIENAPFKGVPYRSNSENTITTTQDTLLLTPTTLVGDCDITELSPISDAPRISLEITGSNALGLDFGSSSAFPSSVCAEEKPALKLQAGSFGKEHPWYLEFASPTYVAARPESDVIDVVLPPLPARKTTQAIERPVEPAQSSPHVQEGPSPYMKQPACLRPTNTWVVYEHQAAEVYAHLSQSSRPRERVDPKEAIEWLRIGAVAGDAQQAAATEPVATKGRLPHLPKRVRLPEDDKPLLRLWKRTKQRWNQLRL